jgi:hypothetical protein
VDSSGNTYLTSITLSANFPTTFPLQPTYSGDQDAFVVKLNAAGSALYSTFLGNNFFEYGYGVAADNSGNAYEQLRKEASLREGLLALRSEIGQFTLDHRRAPTSLTGLVSSGYMKRIPPPLHWSK